VLSSAGLTAQDVARRVTEWAAALPAEFGRPRADPDGTAAADTDQEFRRRT
jgi:hypothetical protein